MTSKDGFPVAIKLQNELQKTYGFCHLAVTHKGYYLQTVSKGRMYAQVLPFNADDEMIAVVKKSFSDFYKPEAKEPEAAGAVEQEPDAKPKRRTRKPAGSAG